MFHRWHAVSTANKAMSLCSSLLKFQGFFSSFSVSTNIWPFSWFNWPLPYKEGRQVEMRLMRELRGCGSGQLDKIKRMQEKKTLITFIWLVVWFVYKATCLTIVSCFCHIFISLPPLPKICLLFCFVFAITTPFSKTTLLRGKLMLTHYCDGMCLRRGRWCDGLQ